MSSRNIRVCKYCTQSGKDPNLVRQTTFNFNSEFFPRILNIIWTWSMATSLIYKLCRSDILSQDYWLTITMSNIKCILQYYHYISSSLYFTLYNAFSHTCTYLYSLTI